MVFFNKHLYVNKKTKLIYFIKDSRSGTNKLP